MAKRSINAGHPDHKDFARFIGLIARIYLGRGDAQGRKWVDELCRELETAKVKAADDPDEFCGDQQRGFDWKDEALTA